MQEARNGAWIQTVTGKQFWPTDARPEEVDIQDIAHALSMLCRFNGHCNRFYSVAEHSVHVSKVIEPEHARWGLLHDAAEAYLSDIPQPVKQELTLFHEFEERLLKVVAERFGLPIDIPVEVKQVDMIMLATEKAALMGEEPATWEGIQEPLDTSMILAWSPDVAKTEFLKHFHELFSCEGSSYV
jgi:uncharacterized protein